QTLKQAIASLTQNGLSDLSAEQALNAIFGALLAELAGNWRFAAEILAMLLLMSLLRNMNSSFGSEVSKAAFYAGYITVAGVAVAVLSDCVRICSNAVQLLCNIVEGVAPVLMLLLTGMGGSKTSGVLSPVLAGLTGSIFTVITTVVFPLILIYAVLSIASNFSTAIRLGKLADLLESVVKWLLGILFIVFLGVTALKGIAGASIDGISFKTAKYTVDKMVPVIGGMFSETLDTIMACSLIVKNAVGIVGLISLVCLIGAPIATLVANQFLLKFSAAAAEPFAEKRSVSLLSAMGKTVQLLTVTLLACTAMAFIFLAVLMGAADMSMMVR
ncbi:MAG: stage III sporulation protein AE, partial [Clostridiales bacterium]|nr:stage III sporulation protein AE [Clostridiales bacterium]